MNPFEIATIVGIVIIAVLLAVVYVCSVVRQLVVRISKVAACTSEVHAQLFTLYIRQRLSFAGISINSSFQHLKL